MFCKVCVPKIRGHLESNEIDFSIWLMEIIFFFHNKHESEKTNITVPNFEATHEKRMRQNVQDRSEEEAA